SDVAQIDYWYRQYQDFMAQYAEGQTPNPTAVQNYANDVLKTVPEVRDQLHSKVIGGYSASYNLLRDFARAYASDPTVDDRETYRILHEYAVFWDLQLNRAAELIFDAYGIRMGTAERYEDYTSSRTKLDTAVTDHRQLIEQLYADLGTPLTNDEIVTIGDLILPRDQADADALPFPALDMSRAHFAHLSDTFTEIYGTRNLSNPESYHAQLAKAGVALPDVIDLSDPDVNVTAYYKHDVPAIGYGRTSVQPGHWTAFTKPTAPGSERIQEQQNLIIAKPWQTSWTLTSPNDEFTNSYRLGEAALVPDILFTQYDTKDPTWRLASPDVIPHGTRVVVNERSQAPTNIAGLPKAPTNAWSMAGATFDVYRDGELVDTVDEPSVYEPGYVDEVTLTVDPAEVRPEGWTIVARGDGDVAFSGLHYGSDTVTLALAKGAFSQVFATVTEAVETSPVTVDVFGDGHVLATYDGQPLGVATAENGTIDVPTGVDTITFSDEPLMNARDGLVLTALESEHEFQGWLYHYTGRDTATMPFYPGSLIWAVFDDSPRVDVSVDGYGTVELFHNGHVVWEANGERNGSAVIHEGEIMVTTDPTAVPGYGWALVATGAEGPLVEWRGEHDGNETAIVPLDPGANEFEAVFGLDQQPATFEVRVAGPGTVDIYHDGQLDQQVSNGGTYAASLFRPDVTFTIDPDDISDQGYTFVGASTVADATLTRWGGDIVGGRETFVQTVGEGAIVDVTASFGQMPAEFDLATSGAGVIDVYLDGAVIDTIDGTGTYVAPYGRTEATLTARSEDVPTSGLSLVARPTGETEGFRSWRGDVVEHDTTTRTIYAGTSIALTAEFAVGAPLTIGGTEERTVQVFEHGEFVEEITTSTTITTFREEIPLLIDLADVPDWGTAIVAVSDTSHRAKEWTGEFVSNGVVRTTPGISSEVTAHFEPRPAVFSVETIGKGTVEVYVDGAFDRTITNAATYVGDDYTDTLVLTDDPDEIPPTGVALLARTAHGLPARWAGSFGGLGTVSASLDPGQEVSVIATV
ncbi:MAG: hypothetical protein AAFY28_08210, partial [Actinomycetota bacterium]